MAYLRFSKYIGAVENYFGVELKDLQSNSRWPELVLPRYILAYLLREGESLSISQIGRILNRHHSTLVYGLRVIEIMREEKPKINEFIERVLNDK